MAEVASGSDFTYVASVGCPDPSGCGPATLTVDFPRYVDFIGDAFNPPTGATVTSVETDPEGVTHLVLTWENLGGTAVAFLPAKIGGMVDAGLNGTVLTTEGRLIAGPEDDQANVPSETQFTLIAYERPGLAAEAQSWDQPELQEGSGATVTSTVTATAAANAPSTLTFRVPGPQGLPGTTLAASEAFDLASLTLTRNPGGAEILFTLEGGAVQTETLGAGTLTQLAPPGTVGYEVRAFGIEPSSAQVAGTDWSVGVTAAYTLRNTQRSSGEPIVAASTNARQVQVNAEVIDTVPNGAPDEPASVSRTTQANIAVRAVPPGINHSITWLTESGESTSVYGSEEPSQVLVRAANSGSPGLSELTLTMPHLNSRYFDYQQLSGAPRVVFPAGATGATVEYRYGKDLTPGAVQEFAPGAAGAWVTVPGPEADAPVPNEDIPALQQVSGITIVFTAADGSAITGDCALDSDCAAALELSGTLRNTLLSSGAEIVPPASGNGETTVGAIAQVTAKAVAGATITQSTLQATLRLVKPQITVKMGKRFGNEDGSDHTVYPLTGIAHAGDLYDPEKTVQDFAEHKLRFVASTTAKEGSSEDFGVTELRISDPERAPTIATLKSNPFNSVQITALSGDPAVCTTGTGDDADPVASRTAHTVWVVDSATDPKTIEQVPFDPTIDTTLIVGLEILVTPADGVRAFPAGVRCASAEGSKVQFRDTQLAGGAKVSPETIGAPETPGLLAVANVAKLGTGKNGDTANGADSLYLVDLLRAAMYKHFAPGASRSGIAGQSPKTSFVLSGVPAASDSVRAVLTDAGGAGEAFDVFALTEVRAARVGPDQKLSITFRDHSGAAVGPVGSVASSTELKLENGATRQLTDEEVADSQSDGYLAFQRIEREIEWDREWADGELDRVGSAAVAVSREDAAEPLQRFGAFSVTLDMTLRTTHALPPNARVTGANDGKKYFNTATIQSENSAGEKTDLLSSAVSYGVFETTALFGDADVSWRAVNQAGNAVDGYLVAQYQTPSRVKLDARNKTALGLPAPVKPEDQWEQSGSIGVGLDRLAVSVGGAAPALTPGDTACVADRDRNPFAINTFAGLHAMTWPTENAAVVKPGTPGPRVAAKIRYSFATGADQVIDAPVDAQIADLNPDAARWDDVIGVAVEWAETDKYVGVFRKQGGTSGSLSFDMTLRDTLRKGFNYEYSEGVPQCLSRAHPDDEVSIDGADQVETETVDQIAKLSAAFEATLGDLEVPALAAADEPAASLMVDVEKSTVELSVSAPSSVFYRDIGQAASSAKQWAVNIRNTGNLDVSALRLATDSELLEGGNWPDQDPDDYAPAPGSAFDAFNVTRASLQYPAGATGAIVWVRGEDGVWAKAGVTGSMITLPVTGSGPATWAEVTGFRVQFEGNEAALKRIQRQATGRLFIDTVLRTHLRSAPDELSPATDLPEGATQWSSDLTAAGVSYIASFDAPRSEVHGATGTATIDAGRPLPLVKKYAQYSSANNTGATSVAANPGSWVNFAVVLENRGNATSNLYGFSVVDTPPAQLRYNAVNASATWKAVVYPSGEEITDDVSFTITGEGAQTLRWVAKDNLVLTPGERVVISAPLQVGDGVAAGETLTNTARGVGSGIPGALQPSACASEQSTANECASAAYATTLRNDSVRAESYINAADGGWTTVDRKGCDPSTISDWADGTWVRNPCVTETTAGGTLKYRLKLINSGNISLAELRFADELPKRGDMGTVLDPPRGSEWTPSLVPGSVRLLVDDEATALGARGDGALGAGFRYSAAANPCSLSPDAFSSADTLACTSSGAAWSAHANADTRAFGADVVFEPTAKLAGGDFVIVEFEMTVPSTNTTPEIAWNTAAVTGRTSAGNDWMPASESPRSGARTQDTTVSVVLGLEDAPVTSWHRDAEAFGLTLSCLSPGASEPTLRDVVFDESVAGPYPKELTISGLPRGGSCAIVDESYDPSSVTADGQYGAVSDGATGYSFATDPAGPLVLDGDGTKNVLSVTNTFVESTVEIGVEADGSASGMIPAGAEFTVDLSCSFAGIERGFGPFKIRAGESEPVTGLPVGAVCTSTETDHRGAGSVTATVDGAPASLDEQRSLTLEPLAPGAHDVTFVNAFEAGGTLTVLKRVDLPSAGLAVGDVAFSVSCELGGYPIDIGDRAELRHTFAPGETEAMLPVTGIPAGAECTVSETVTGGADVPAPDRTVTVLPEDEVIVEMLNVFEPAALELTKALAGPGSREARVPSSFDLRATCSRELTIGGELVTVTDFDGLSAVAPNEPLRIGGLPSGSSCAVTEPELRGAESVELVSLTTDAPDEDPSADALRVTLVGPDAEGDAVATRVQVTNRFAATEGLGATGDAGWLFAGGIGVLLLGLGAVALTRRRGAVAE